MPIRIRLFPLTGLALFAAIAITSAADTPDTEMLAPYPHPKGYVCFRAPSPITIDGKATEPAWDAAPWTEAFVDIEGDKRPKPKYRTRVKMLWDDEALYIAAELEEPHVWATLQEHDSIIFNDNDFEMFLNPTGDNHSYCELEMNALNTTWDLFLTKPYKDKGRALHAWEITGLKTAVHVDGTLNDPRDKDMGWTIEIKWPWTGLEELAEISFPPKHGDKWRINFSRVEWDTEIVDGKYRKVPGRDEHNWVWSPQGVIDMHRPERWGYLQFSTAKPGQDVFQPDPDWSHRDLLHRAYYAQRAYYKMHEKYATTLRELGLKDTSKLTMEATRSFFEISTSILGEKGASPRKLTIAQDSRISVE
jgi:hypothetical protein